MNTLLLSPLFGAFALLAMRPSVPMPPAACAAPVACTPTGSCAATDDSGTWSQWYGVSNGVYVSFKLSHCENGMLSGYSFYRTNTTIGGVKGWLRFRYEFRDCEGDIRSEGVSVDLSKVGVDDNMGQWFMGNQVTKTYIGGSIDVDLY